MSNEPVEKGTYTQTALEVFWRFRYWECFDGFNSFRWNSNASQVNYVTEKRERRPAKLTFLLVQEESFFLEPLKEAVQVFDVILLGLASHDHIVHVHEIRERQITKSIWCTFRWKHCAAFFIPNGIWRNLKRSRVVMMAVLSCDAIWKLP